MVLVGSEIRYDFCRLTGWEEFCYFTKLNGDCRLVAIVYGLRSDNQKKKIASRSKQSVLLFSVEGYLR